MDRVTPTELNEMIEGWNLAQGGEKKSKGVGNADDMIRRLEKKYAPKSG